jgi:uncharacterized damage-inducible protein DinB
MLPGSPGCGQQNQFASIASRARRECHNARQDHVLSCSCGFFAGCNECPPSSRQARERSYHRGPVLAEAVAADKYKWRPAEGVRSIGEVYAHIAAANYGIARAFGTQLPAGIDPQVITAAAGDKPKTIEALKDSFAHFRQAILALNDANADKPQKMFGRQTTERGAFIMVTGHLGEHLGQSIAYARMNGIVPPWTEEAQRQKSAEKPKP